MKRIFLLPILFLLAPLFGDDLDEQVWVYIDADFTRHRASAKAIEMGLKTALDEVNSKIGHRRIKVKSLDHRGNSVRSKRNMEDFLEDEKALFIMGGLHSPPLIQHRSWINEMKIPVVVPWAAGGPITRHPSKMNWIFRCSVDDTKAGRALAQYALNNKGMKNPGLVMEDTPWGRGNYENVKNALKKSIDLDPTIVWFNWNTKEAGAKIKLRSLIEKGHDGIILVGNAVESLAFCRAMGEFDNPVPIVSHWGITGGDFQQKLGNKLLSELDLSFIQTSFSFISSPETELSRSVWERASGLFPDLRSPSDLLAPTGFIHAYDLMKMSIAAMKMMKWEKSAHQSRGQFRKALENLSSPIEGLIKTYETPFSVWDANNQDAHEALGFNDLKFGRFLPNGSITLKNNP